MKLLVLDGNSLVNRAFYGIKILTTKDNRPTNAIYGFLNILLNLLRENQPDEVAIAWDLKAPTFRHKMFDGYKATRHGMPDDLVQQMPVLKELLAELGFVMVSREGWEADDLLGTLSAAAATRGDECLLATGDRDSLQLVNEHVTVLLASTRGSRSETVPMDPEAIREKYGLENPRQLIEVKSLMGDTSDNIPGVPGVGEKTALALVQAFGSLDEVYAHLDDPRIKPGVRKKLTENEDKARLSHTLGEIRLDAPIDTAPGAYRRGPGEPEKAAALLASLEMHSLIPRLGLTESAAPAAPAEERTLAAADAPLTGQIFLVALPAGDRWAAVDERGIPFRLEGQALTDLLDSPDAHLWVFDAKPLYHLALAAGGVGRAIEFDGKLAAYLLNPAASKYELEALAAEYGVAPAFTCPDAPDAGLLAGLLPLLDAKLAELGMDKLLREIELPLARVLADMERTGMLVDRDGIAAFGDELRAQLNDCLDRIYGQVGYFFNLNSPKQLGEALFDKLGLPHRKKTKSGYSTDAATLESLRSYSPVIEDILEYRSCQKLLSTYADGLLKVIGPDGRVHSTFLQTEARTGRLSSTEPNLQNIPVRTEQGSRLRGFFVAKPGCILLDADYSQIELRILAHISGDEAMQEIFRTGGDIHRSTAARIYGMPPEMITPRLRSSAKAVNFGIVYGIGAYSLSRDIGVTVKEAEAFINSYLDSFPGVRKYMDDTIAFGKEHGYVATLFGRRRALPELTSSSFNVRALGERMAMNTPIQGTAADIIKLAMVRVWRRLRAEGMQSRLILTVHDELIVEAPEAEAARAAEILQHEMEHCVSYSVPLSVEAKIGRNWLQAH